MQRLIEPTTDPARVHPKLAAYLAAITGHCPFLGPSMRRELTTWSGYQATPDDLPDLTATLAETVERLRERRRRTEDGALLCHNIAIFGPVDIPSARAVLDWPAWIIRNLYAPAQVMIGRFWIGEQRKDRSGRDIVAPPVSFVSIRTAFPCRDAQFLTGLPQVAAQLANSHDDGRDVLTPLLGIPYSPQAIADAYETLVQLFPAPAPDPDRKVPVT